MKISEYLKTLKPKQEVMVVLVDGNERHIIAKHEAGFLAKSTKPGWVRLDVVETEKIGKEILIDVKDNE